MAIQETRWRPDTCTCLLVYEWDSLVTLTNRVHTFKRADVICPEHQSLLTELDAYTAALENNQRKNKTVNYVNTQLAIDPSSIIFSFSGMGNDRILNIEFTSAVVLTNLQKLGVQQWADTNFGVGKVIVQ